MSSLFSIIKTFSNSMLGQPDSPQFNQTLSYLGVRCGGVFHTPLWNGRIRESISFLCLPKVMGGHAAMVAPVITPNLSAVWVDGCANLSAPCSSLAAGTVSLCLLQLIILATSQSASDVGWALLSHTDKLQTFLQVLIHFCLLTCRIVFMYNS